MPTKKNKKPRAHMDIESYSECDLTTKGVYNYAKHPSTEIISIAWQVDDGETHIWTREESPTIPAKLRVILANRSFDLAAHNAEFEKIMLCGPAGKEIGIESEWLTWDRWICTRAKALTYGLPASLEKCAKALELEQLKDNKGKKLIKLLSMPCKVKKKAHKRTEEDNRSRVNGKMLPHLDDEECFYYRVLPEHDPEAYKDFYEYNIQDVVVEAEIDRTLWDIRDFEREVWIVDKHINELGVKADMEIVYKVIEFASKFKDDLTKEFKDLTGGLKPTQGKAFIEWVGEKGHKLENAQATYMKEYLEANADSMTDELKRAFEIKSLLGKASMSKYQKIVDLADEEDHRVRGSLEYHGAATGRWAARGFQIQNLTKETKEYKQEEIIRDLKAFDYETMLMVYGDIYQAFKCCLRGALIPETGHKFAVPDWSQIEARVLPWLAGDEGKLDIFRNDQDVYKIAAAGIYGMKVEDIADGSIERTIGKVAELALGYMGGKGSVLTFAGMFGIPMEEEKAEDIKLAWRETNPRICELWYALERAAKMTIKDRKRYKVGKHLLVQRLDDFLLIKLPSGRCLFYYKPCIVNKMMPWGKKKDCIEYMGVKSDATRPGSKQYMNINTHGGKLTENVTQAVARDLLAEALVIMFKKGMKLPFHVHDEVIVELLEKTGLNLNEIYAILCTNPTWAQGLPLDADGWIGERYNK